MFTKPKIPGYLNIMVQVHNVTHDIMESRTVKLVFGTLKIKVQTDRAPGGSCHRDVVKLESG